MIKAIKCGVCGCEFPAVNERHYIARDSEKTGVVVALSHDEGKLYDAFDCPMCGCQVIIQERKRSYIPCNEFDDEELEEFDDE